MRWPRPHAWHAHGMHRIFGLRIASKVDPATLSLTKYPEMSNVVIPADGRCEENVYNNGVDPAI